MREEIENEERSQNLERDVRRIEESKIVTDSMRHRIHESTQEFSIQIEEKEDEIKRKGEIERGYQEVAFDLKSLLSQKEHELAQLKAEVMFFKHTSLTYTAKFYYFSTSTTTTTIN